VRCCTSSKGNKAYRCTTSAFPDGKTNLTQNKTRPIDSPLYVIHNPWSCCQQVAPIDFDETANQARVSRLCPGPLPELASAMLNLPCQVATRYTVYAAVPSSLEIGWLEYCFLLGLSVQAQYLHTLNRSSPSKRHSPHFALWVHAGENCDSSSIRQTTILRRPYLSDKLREENTARSKKWSRCRNLSALKTRRTFANWSSSTKPSSTRRV
jgi:hypothetical protein